MARFTVDEDCLLVIKNRFDMTLIASSRARALENGSTPLIENRKYDKSLVISLREIGQNKINSYAKDN